MPAFGVQQAAEEEIQRLQRERVKLTEDLERKKDELASAIEKHMLLGVGTAEIGKWLTTDDRPGGVSRQNVYKFVNDRSTNRVLAPEPKPRPKRPRPTRA